jgi:hypothetical protein
MRLTGSGRVIERYCDRDSSTELPPVPNLSVLFMSDPARACTNERRR